MCKKQNWTVNNGIMVRFSLHITLMEWTAGLCLNFKCYATLSLKQSDLKTKKDCAGM